MSLEEDIVNTFVELVNLDSHSYNERKVADWIINYLTNHGYSVLEDTAFCSLKGNAGNIFATLKGNAGNESVLFSSHMDVVEPSTGKSAVVLKDVITSNGKTILGADDIAGIVEILYGVELAKNSGKPMKNVELLFSVAEETYAKGSSVFDYSKIQSTQAYVLDLEGTIGKAARKAPSIIGFNVNITGKSAHAGFCPEEGINAILVAANAIAKIKQGHVDEETTVNIGTIAGGTQTNIVSETCVCTGEVRGFSHKKALEYINCIKEVFKTEATKLNADVTFNSTVHIKAYEISEDSPAIKNFKTACDNLGIDSEITSTLGGSDNNNFADNGIDGIVLSCGMYNAHSLNEYTKISDLVLGAKLVGELIIS